MEIWKDIEGYEGLYQVSNLGRVRSLNYNRTGTTKYLHPGRQNKTKHMTITLCKDGKSKSFSLHRVVASTFIQNPNKYPCVNHIDEDPTNNIVSNLEWCTHLYNNNYGQAVTKRSRLVKCIETGEVHYINDWATILGVNRQTIDAHLQGRQKQVKSFHFVFLDQ